MNGQNGYLMSPPPPGGMPGMPSMPSMPSMPTGMPGIPGHGAGLAPGQDTPDAFHQFVKEFEGHQGHARQAVEHHQQELRRIDHEREGSFNGLVHMYKQLLEKYTQKCEDYDNEVVSRRNWHREANDFKRQFDQLELAAESSPFAAVILDGDGAVFSDALLANGHEGGVQAAHLLLSNVKNQLKNIYPKSNIDDWSIIVQIAMSVPGLGKKLQDVGLIHSQGQLADFIHGFNYSQALFSIIDVGRGSQRADGKCREMARLMARVKQCKHIFFGPCHDLGYIPVLQALRDPFGGGVQRVTLVETVSALQGFKELQLPFTRLAVFRSELLPNAAPRTSVAPPTPPPSQQPLSLRTADVTTNFQAASRPSAISPAQGSASSPAGGAPLVLNGGAAAQPKSFAAASKTGVAPNSKINIAPAKKAPAPKYYLINKDSERVDETLPNMLPAAEKRYYQMREKNNNYCNEFHLKGSCDPEFCQYFHGPVLAKALTTVIQHKARGMMCVNGSYCDDVECYFGHNCRYGRHCTGSDCKFRNVHYVDITPAYRIYEDGTKESFS